MKKLIASILVLIVLGVQSAVFAKPAKRIYFKKGATKAVVTGTMNGYKSKDTYVLRVREGQTLKVDSNRSVTLAVVDPSGEDVMDRDLSCNGRAEISPTVAGDYKIIVVECMKADPWRGSYKLNVSVK
ncbi:MAG: hypothetical protein LUM44_21430 [Pyrinomonadaceae bacterium]|nr:hypothetical protein [Pyrinomonadaceae bacterium]